MLGSLLPAREQDESRSGLPSLGWQGWQTLFSFNGSQYQPEPFKSYYNSRLLAQCGPVSAVLDRRTSVMGEARPTWQRLEQGKPTQFFSTRDLDILKSPWPGGSFRQLAAICEADVAATGNSYWMRMGDELCRVNPDWVTIVTEEVGVNGVQVGERLVGYIVTPPSSESAVLDPSQVAHYKPGAPTREPWRGESWLAAVASDASSDIEMTHYKGNYLKNGAMSSLAVMYEPNIDQAQIEQYVDVFKEKFVGTMNAGKVLHLLGGRDVKTVGATLEDLAFKAVQGAGETRIASAAGVPAVVAGFSEGMQGSSLNAGNYVATRRLFADAKIRPILGSFCEAFSTLVPAPVGARLWFDDSGVSFFQEDVADEADIRQQYASTIRTLIEAGYDPDAVVSAVISGNFAALNGQHSGLTSVQLQEPASGSDDPSNEGNSDGFEN